MERTAGLIVDTNLLVLYVVGSVNPERIETFKRTRQYARSDYDLLVRVLDKFDRLYSLAHVLAEVSNLTDLSGDERLLARLVLKKTISELTELEMASSRAAEDPLYQDLGLTDAAIGALARAHGCAVLTDDLGLYLMLSGEIEVHYFTHLRATEWALSG